MGRATSGIRTLFFVFCAGLLLAACAASDSEVQPADGPPDGAGGSAVGCVPGAKQYCTCPDGYNSVKYCQLDGSGYGECVCESGQGGSGGDPGPCGDGECTPADDENCHTCVIDCGSCAPCDIAPECKAVQVPPTQLSHMEELDIPKMKFMSRAAVRERLERHIVEANMGMRVLAAALDSETRVDEHAIVTKLRSVFTQHPAAASVLRQQLANSGLRSLRDYRDFNPPAARFAAYQPMDIEYPGGTMECGSPLLRVGVSKLIVHEEDDDVANDEVYCVIQAEAPAGGEIRVTPKTPPLDEGDSYLYSLSAGVFWGQLEPVTPGGDLQITYDCIECDDPSQYVDLLDAIAEAAFEVGGVVGGEAGWVLLAVGLVSKIVALGLSLDGDDQLFNAQHVVPLNKQLQLTNGGFWTVRRDGTHNLSDWDWELYVQAWGCAEYGTL